MAFQDKVFALRKQKKWSQEQLAEQLDVSRQTISKWESGLAMPDMGKMTQLSQLFGVTLDDLVNDKEPEVHSDKKDKHAGPENKEQARFGKFPKKYTLLAAVLLAVGAVVWGALRSFAPVGPNAAINEYIATAEVAELHRLEPNAVRLILLAQGVDENYTDRQIEIAVEECLKTFFKPYVSFGLVYENGVLNYKSALVKVFQENESEHTRILWQDGGTATVVAARNSQGIITGFETCEEE